MPVVQLDIGRRGPYEAGRVFGPGGAYELVEGVARFAVDPDAPGNACITDLRLAPRDGAGMVGFEADFCVLRPADPARSSGRLLFSVANRGRRTSVPFSVFAVPPPAEPTERIDPGDGFLLQRGWSIAWCGWQWDVVRRPGAVGLSAPQARLPAADRDGEVLVQFQPHVRQTCHHLGHWPLDPPPGVFQHTHAPYRPRDLDDPAAVLAVRDHPRAPAVEVPRASWRFGREVGGRVTPDAACVWLAEGFQPGRVYELRYRPRDCPVVGVGLLAVRDFVSHLRDAAVAGRIEHTFAFGVSQSGRFLRELLHLALNVDGTGRRVFDGVFVHVAGARRGEFNQRYGQPSVQHAPGLGHLPPFADGDLLERQRARGGLPRVFSINTSSEYWRSEASLTHMD
ncbi:MAG TPA: alpha/beta hydrolase domain-containing protein, partial [Candidatus Eisenbacteria bacterium]|nr:alpha/beta hydrolase domain-containing protein [Candidatus Eisenbacteria bacterium]